MARKTAYAVLGAVRTAFDRALKHPELPISTIGSAVPDIVKAEIVRQGLRDPFMQGSLIALAFSRGGVEGVQLSSYLELLSEQVLAQAASTSADNTELLLQIPWGQLKALCIHGTYEGFDHDTPGVVARVLAENEVLRKRVIEALEKGAAAQASELEPLSGDTLSAACNMKTARVTERLLRAIGLAQRDA